MRGASSDVIVLRSVYLPKALDARIRAAAFQADLDEGDLIARLIADGLAVGRAVDGTSVEATSVVAEVAVEEDADHLVQ